MIQTRRRLRFTAEPNECFLRFGLITQDAFQRDNASRMTLARAINDAHPAASDFLQDLIIANPPIGIAHVDVIENLFERLRGLSFAAEGAAEHAIQAKPAPYARCR